MVLTEDSPVRSILTKATSGFLHIVWLLQKLCHHGMCKQILNQMWDSRKTFNFILPLSRYFLVKWNQLNPLFCYSTLCIPYVTTTWFLKIPQKASLLLTVKRINTDIIVFSSVLQFFAVALFNKIDVLWLSNLLFEHIALPLRIR